MLSRERIAAVFGALDATDTAGAAIIHTIQAVDPCRFARELNMKTMEQEREARWVRQGLYNTPEENAKANEGKGRLNPCRNN